MKNKCLALIICAFAHTSLQASPNDLYLTTKNPQFNTQTGLSVIVAIDAVNDKIDFLDFRAKEGVQNNQTGDYIGGHILAEYNLNPNWKFDVGYWDREIQYASDENQIKSTQIGVMFTPNLNLTKNNALAFKLSAWTNTASDLKKSTSSHINGYIFDQIRVKDPEDLQLQFDAVFTKKIDFMNTLSMVGNIGYSKVKVKELEVNTRYQNCAMNINIGSNNQYSGQLAQPCQIDNTIVHKLDISGQAEEFGLNMEKDLNYDSYFTSLGGSWNLKYKKFESQVAYQYQRLWRNDIDERVSNFGNQPIKDNHTLGVKFSYEITPKISTFIQGELYKHNLVGKIPFLYNGVTASRLDKKYGIASLGLNFKLF